MNPSYSNRSVGNKIEERISLYLQKKGYRILERNFQIKGGEIDIVTEESNSKMLVFFEVKYRKNEFFGHPLDTYTTKKRRALGRTIRFYCLKHHIDPESVRLDFIAVMPQKTSYRIWWVRGIEF